ncbi:MAG: hypothetical protein LC664_06265, partial [Flavobacteriales bacterium]|nr:hypothetical protein [Flavobacteriales bacterium]
MNCNNTISSFPYAEGFESGTGLFVQSDNDDFDWSVNSGETDTDNSGPSSAFEGANYLYIESSGPNYPNNSAAISTPCFDLTGLPTPTAYFEYHMYGSAIGELVLQARTDETSWTTIWSQNGDQGTQWLSAEVDLGTYSDSDNLKLRFSATTTTSFTGDIAIDNFSVEEFVEEPVLNCDATLSNFPYLLNFENGLQNWNQNQEDDFDWTVGSGPTPTFQTGPEAASAGSSYLYIETSAPNYPNKSAAFTSPCLDISGLDNPTLYFNYHMFGTIGALEVEARNENGDWNTIWSLNGDQGNSWFLAEVALLEYLDNPGLKLRFTGTSANLFNGDIAIDQIEITEAGEESANAFCATNISDFPYSESFESGLGAWTQSDTDDFDWETTSGATPSMGTGPDAAYDESAYAFAESSAPNYPNKSALITSPCFDISALDEPAISFAYHMFGSNMGSLVLEARTESSGWTQLWAENGNQGNTWNNEVFNLLDFAGSNEIKFRFTGTTAQGFTSDFALDLIEIDEAGELEAETACASPIAAFPYLQSFETGLENWSQSSEDNTDWTLNSGATPTFNTGPSSASDESQYLYLESSYPHYPQKTAIIESPCFDISSLSTPQIAFDYHMYGGAIGSLSLEILNDNQEWQTIWSESGDQSNLWNTAVAELSGFGSPETTALRFVATSGNGFTSDIAIDYIRIGSEFGEIEAVNCPPINFNSTRIRSHGSNQDAGTHTISDGGYTILLENNAWKAAAFNYDVTEETVLELEFRSSSQGEIHGIGFDSDGNISADLTFQLYGSQSWGILNYNDYSAG